MTNGKVRHPRHFIYRVKANVVIVSRILHDSMELERYLDLSVWD